MSGSAQYTGSVQPLVSSAVTSAHASFIWPLQLQPRTPSLPLARCTAARPRRTSTAKGQLSIAYRQATCPCVLTHSVCTPSDTAAEEEVSVTHAVRLTPKKLLLAFQKGCSAAAASGPSMLIPSSAAYAWSAQLLSAALRCSVPSAAMRTTGKASGVHMEARCGASAHRCTVVEGTPTSR